MSNNNLSVLLVEDEFNLGQTLSSYLERKGHLVYWAQTASQAHRHFKDHSIELILMDIGLPDQSGLQLAKELKDINPSVILLFLSAQSDPDTKVEGLAIGAEDFISKPFNLKELTMRLERILEHRTAKTIINKNNNEHASMLKIGPLFIHFDRFQLEDAWGNLIDLSQKEWAILDLLTSKLGQVISRDEMLEKIWGEGNYPTNRTIDNYIVKLRKWTDTSKEIKPQKQIVQITSVRSIGYKLEILS